MSRREFLFRKHLKWRLRMRRLLPHLEARIKALDGVVYKGKGYHYALRWDLYKLMRILGAPADRDIGGQVIDEVIGEGLCADIARAERSARNDFNQPVRA